MIVPISYANIRAASPAVDTIYFMTDPGRQGFWYQGLGTQDFTNNQNNGWSSIQLDNGTYVRRDLTSEQPRLSWAGILPTNSVAQNVAAFQAFLITLATGVDLPSFYLAAGSYHLDNYTIAPGGAALRLIGDGIAQFIGLNGTTMLEISTNGGYYENIVFNGSNPGTPPQDANGNQILDYNAYLSNSLVKVHGVTRFQNCEFINSAGHGLYVSGQLSINMGDSSLSSFVFCKFRGNNGAGRYVGSPGLDSNHSIFFGCDQRDNLLEGYIDNSFLGNIDIASHSSTNHQGHMKVLTVDNKALVVGAYEEDGFPPSQFLGRASVMGSRISGTPVLNEFVFYNDANAIRSIQTPKLHMVVSSAPFADGSDGMLFQGPGNGAPIFALHSTGGADQTLYELVNTQTQEPAVLQFYGPRTPVPVLGRAELRTSQDSSINLARFTQGNRDVIYVEDYSELTTNNVLNARQWVVGDEIRRYSYVDTQPQYLLCVQAGQVGASFPIPIHGITDPNYGGGFIVTQAEAAYLLTNTPVQINGVATTVYGQQLSPSGYPGMVLIVTNSQIPYHNGPNGWSPVTPPEPKFVGVIPQTVPW